MLEKYLKTVNEYFSKFKTAYGENLTDEIKSQDKDLEFLTEYISSYMSILDIYKELTTKDLATVNSSIDSKYEELLEDSSDSRLEEYASAKVEELKLAADFANDFKTYDCLQDKGNFLDYYCLEQNVPVNIDINTILEKNDTINERSSNLRSYIKGVVDNLVSNIYKTREVYANES